MIIKLSHHARTRLKERFSSCPSFGGKLREANLKFVEDMPHKKSKIYKYFWGGHHMYLFIGDDGTVITILTPQMYKAWVMRWIISNSLLKVTKLFGFKKYNCLSHVNKFTKMLVPLA